MRTATNRSRAWPKAEKDGSTETNTVRELVHGAVGVDGRGFAEQNHRDGAKRNRDDRLSNVKGRLVVWSFDEQSESNFLSVCKICVKF